MDGVMVGIPSCWSSFSLGLLLCISVAIRRILPSTCAVPPAFGKCATTWSQQNRSQGRCAAFLTRCSRARHRFFATCCWNGSWWFVPSHFGSKLGLQGTGFKLEAVRVGDSSANQSGWHVAILLPAWTLKRPPGQWAWQVYPVEDGDSDAIFIERVLN